jgi:hypothetical protein
MTSSCSAVCRAPAAGATFLYGVSSIAVLQLVEPMLLAVCADGGAVHLFLHSIPFVYQQHAWGWCVMPPLCSNCVGQSNACMHACMHARAHTHTHTHTETHARTHTHTCTYARSHTHTDMFAGTCTRACPKTCTHAPIHEHAHSHTCTGTPTCRTSRSLATAPTLPTASPRSSRTRGTRSSSRSAWKGGQKNPAVSRDACAAKAPRRLLARAGSAALYEATGCQR